MTRKEFIYSTLKPGTNSLKSTEFWTPGIRKWRTKTMIREAMELGMPLIMKCKIMGTMEKADYENSKWVEL